MTDEDFEEFIGSAPKPPKQPARRASRAKAHPYAGQVRADASVAQALMNPVTITFLAQVMEMDRITATKKLAKLPPLGMHRGNTPVYSFKQAMSYLAAPMIDPQEIAKRLTAGDLPPGLQKDVWDAKLKMQKWQQAAGELWPTEDVLEVLGEAFKRLKTTTQLWTDQVAENQSLPDATRAELMTLVDGLQADLHRALVEMPKDRATKSQLAEVEGTDLDGAV